MWRTVQGLNEEIAATSVWGSQQVSLFEDRTKDGVFALWCAPRRAHLPPRPRPRAATRGSQRFLECRYGKGPGVDRSGDVFKHANMAGLAPAPRTAADPRRTPRRPCVRDAGHVRRKGARGTGRRSGEVF